MANPLVRLGQQIPEGMEVFLRAFKRTFMEPPSAAPRPGPTQRATQLRLPLSQPRGAINPNTGRSMGGQLLSPRQVSPRDRETVRLGLQRTQGVVSPGPLNRVGADQGSLLNLDSRLPGVELPTEAINLRSQDPGTYNSIVDLAVRAEEAYGIPAPTVLQNLVRPGAGKYLQSLEQGSTSLVPSAGGSLRPPGGVGSAQMMGSPGGSLTRSPGGPLGTVPPIERVSVTEIPPAQRGAISAGRGQGAQVISSPGGALAERGGIPGMREPDITNAYTGTEDFVPRADGPAMRNAVGGVRLADLNNVQKRLLAAGGYAGLTGLGFGSAAYMQDRIPDTIMGQPTASVETGPRLPAVTGEESPNQTAPIGLSSPLASPVSTLPSRDQVGVSAMPDAPAPAAPPIGQQPVPSAPILPPPPPGVAGAGQVVTRTRGDQEADLVTEYQRAMAGSRLTQQPGEFGDMGGYKEAGSYYATRGKYAGTPEGRKQVQEQLQQMGGAKAFGVESQAAFDAWANANPALAYDLVQRSLPRLPKQQMPTQKGVVLGTSFGTDQVNNPVGFAQTAATAAVAPTQGAVDMNDALRPQTYPVLQNVDYRAIEQLFYGTDGIKTVLNRPTALPR